MRIALIAPLVTPIREPQLRGSQAFLSDLAAGLTTRGHAVHVYAAAGSAIPGVTVVDTGVDAESLTASRYRADGTAAIASGPMEAAFRCVYAGVRRGDYDVVHNHAFDAPAVRLARDLAMPIIHTLHLPPDASVRAALAEVVGGVSPPTVAAVSRSQARAWGITTILPDGVPVASIPWSDRPGDGVVFAGRFSPEKGGAEAIEIAGRAGVRIDLYGDPYDRNYAASRIDPSRDRPGVTIHAGVPRAELWRVMSRAAVALCPAKWDEPFGMVAAEAQAAGTPVVAFRRGGLAEVIVDGTTGYLTPPDDLDAAAEAVMRIGAIRREACRRHAEANLNLEASLDAHERLYETVRRTAAAHA